MFPYDQVIIAIAQGNLAPHLVDDLFVLILKFLLTETNQVSNSQEKYSIRQ
jgi:hypothetical protein